MDAGGTRPWMVEGRATQEQLPRAMQGAIAGCARATPTSCIHAVARKEFERRADGPLVDYVKNERGLVTRGERDSYRDVIEEMHPDGTQQSWKYLPALSHVREYTDELGVRSS